MGRRVRVLPGTLLPASAQKYTVESVWRHQRPWRGRRRQPPSEHWALLLPSDEEEAATVQRLRKNPGLCLGMVKGQ